MKELLKLELRFMRRVNGLRGLIDSEMFVDDEIFMLSLGCNLEIALIDLFVVRSQIKALEMEMKQSYKRK